MFMKLTVVTEAAYFSGFKWSWKLRSGELKRSVWNCIYENEIVKHCWEAEHKMAGIRRKLLLGKTG